MDNRQIFINALRATERPGVDRVIAELEKLGFFTAPASTAFHLNTPGGLLQHSVNVYKEAMAIREKQIEMKPEIADKLPVDSVAIASLLHDVCKRTLGVIQLLRGGLLLISCRTWREVRDQASSVGT